MRSNFLLQQYKIMVIKRGHMFKYNFSFKVQSNLVILPLNVFKVCKTLMQSSSKSLAQMRALRFLKITTCNEVFLDRLRMLTGIDRYEHLKRLYVNINKNLTTKKFYEKQSLYDFFLIILFVLQ